MPGLRRSTRRLRQLWAVMCHPLEQLDVRRTFARARRHGVAVPGDHAAFKYVGDYLAVGLTREERAAALRHHYDFLRDLDPSRDGGGFFNAPLALWRLDDDEGRRHDVTLQPAWLAPMEGEHELLFQLDGKRLYTLTFSIVSGRMVGWGAAPVLLIGGMQGGYWSREPLRYAARKNGEIAAPTMLLLAASVLADALGIASMAGPSNRNQAARGYAVDGRSSSLDYDELWTQADGLKNERDFFIFPTVRDEEADTPVTGKHRSRTRRRRLLRAALRAEMQDMLRQALPAGRANEVAEVAAPAVTSPVLAAD